MGRHLPTDLAQALLELQEGQSHVFQPATLFAKSGGGGNRTRVRGRTGKSLYKLVLRFDFARRPVAGHLSTG